MGRTGMLYDSIVNLNQCGHEIVLIITGEESSEYTRGISDFKRLGAEIGCECIVTENINQKYILDCIRQAEPDIAISINWKTLIGKDIINLFPHGIINAHAGDLPRYRGNAVPNWAIIAGEREIVVTLHKMDAGLDSGPILLKRRLSISESTRIGEVYAFLETQIPRMYVVVLEGIQNGTILPQKQSDDPAEELRCYPRTQRDGEIDWTLPAKEIHRLIQAVSEPFAGAYTFIGWEKLIIWRSNYEIPAFQYMGVPGQVAHRDLHSGTVKVVTGDGFLILEEVEVEGTGERQRPSEVIKTIRTRLGMDITGQITCLKKRIDTLEDKINSRHLKER